MLTINKKEGKKMTRIEYTEITQEQHNEWMVELNSYLDDVLEIGDDEDLSDCEYDIDPDVYDLYV